ncbi:MAG: cation:proton antiporter [Actinobacteria bacterium]|nr:cation:proton antiporter [Actinomycetota bacterium]
MPETVSFEGLVIVVVVAFAMPLVLGLFPKARLPSAVLEIVAGIVIGPAALGWVDRDVPIQILALVGLAFLLFIGGLEIDLHRLRGRLLRVAATGFVLSLAIALLVSVGLDAAGLVETPLIVAVIVSSTGLGVVIAVLKDSGESTSEFGQLLIVGASLSDFGAIVLLTLLFSRDASSPGSRALLLCAFALLAVVAGLAIAGAGRWTRLNRAFTMLQDTTAQIRVRGSMVLLIGFVAMAETLGLETILGAFIAGAILSAIDRDRTMTHPAFRQKLEAMGFGLFIPVFFVSSGIAFDLSALTSSASALARVPVFLITLLVVHAVPVALTARGLVGSRRAIAAGLLQSTTLSFVVATAAIGTELGLLGRATGAALIAAGLLSVLLFPVIAAALLQGDAERASGVTVPVPRP